VATTTLTGTTGNDILNAPGSVTTLVAGLQGNDTITLARSGDEAYGQAGNDTIRLSITGATTNTVNGGAGRDTLSLGSAVGNFGGVVSLDDGADFFANTGSIAFVAASFDAGAGHDTISLEAGNVTNSTIAGGNGFDSIAITGAGTYANAAIFGGNGADTVNISAAAAMTFTSIQSGDGHDRILATALAGSTSIAIAAGAGLDSIYLGTTTVGSVAGGSGNDTIRFTGAVGGASTIFGDSLSVSEATTDGSDVISLSAAAMASAVSVYGGGGNDTIGLGALNSSTLISGGGGNDVIGNTALAITTGATISGGDGNDSINVVTLASGSEITGGSGNDTIALGFSGVAMYGSVSGGAGADLISSRAVNASLSGALLVGTIDGGDGSDTIAFGSALLFSAAGGTELAAAAYTTQTAAITNVVYGSGDVITFTGSFISAANWLTNTAIVVGTSANGIGAAGAFTGAGNTAVGSVGVFSYGNDFVFGFYDGDAASLVQYLNVINGKSALLKNTTAAGLTTLNSTNFGFTLTSYQNGIQITFS